MKLTKNIVTGPRQILLVILSCLLAACGGGGGSSGTSGSSGGGASPTTTTPPKVVLTNPAKTVPIVTGVATNRSILAKFSTNMLASSINTSSVKLSCPSGTPVVGTVTYDSVNKSAIFRPTSNMPVSTTCEATITTAVTDTAGVAMASNYVWSFTTGTGPDFTAPTITGNSPTNNATGVCLSSNVSVTFSESMDPSTINSTTFTVTNPSSAVMPGVVSYNSISNVATFAVTNPTGYVANTIYTAQVTTGAKDLAGNALALPLSISFTTGSSACGAPLINLGTISTFGSFGGGAGATNSGLNTVITGDIGTTGVCTMITGFHDINGVTYTETPLNQGDVVGQIYCAPPSPGTVEKLAVATKAATDARSAYNELVAITPSSTKYDQLGGLTLAPGTYSSLSTLHVTSGNLTLDAAGNADATWVFQAPSSLTVGLTATPREVILTGGAQAKNVYWQVYSAARIEIGSKMVGTIIAQAGVTISTAGTTIQTTLDGRAIGLDASVTMVNTTINIPD